MAAPVSEVFVSYARSTEAEALRIEAALRALGYSVLRDDELPAHRSYAEAIEERLRGAKAVVVVWSTEAVLSEWVQSEADHARLARKLVQLSIDGATPPMPFDRIQCADLRGWRRDPAHPGWRKVVESLAALTGGRHGRERGAPVDLAEESDFTLGAATIHPSISEVAVGPSRIRLQPRVMQVLVALARADGQVVSRDDLVASCWGGLAIGDDAIQRCIARLRKLAEGEAPGAFAVETLPRIGYRLTRSGAAERSGAAFATADVTARARALTPWLLGLASLAVGMVAVVAWFIAGPTALSPRGHAVAVLPLDAPPGDAAAKEFAAGVTAQLAHFLSPSEMRIISPERTAGLSGRQRSDLARTTGSQFTVDGSVQRDEVGLGAAVTLTDLPSQALLWSATFSRPADQTAAMQAQVATKIAEVLACAKEAEAAGARPQSVALYVRACEWQVREDDLGGAARDLLRQVVEREPRFARAWSALAEANALAVQTLPADQAAKARQEAVGAAARALHLDPKQGGAFAARAVLATSASERRALVRKGLAADPDNAELNDIQAFLMGEIGRMADAEKFARRAAVLDPFSPAFAADLARHVVDNDGLVEAEVIAERAAQVWPDNENVLATRLVILGYWGDPDRALALLADPKARPFAWEPSALADFRRFILLRKSGDRSQIEAYARDELARLAAGKDEPSHALRLLSTLGVTDAAFAAADRALAAGSLRTDFLFGPSYGAMRRDPRFMPLVARAGLVAVWRESGQWPDFCAAPDRPYDCAAVAARTG